MISTLMEILSVVCIAIMVLCIVTSIIVQLTKNTKYLDKIPTELETIVVCVGLAVVSFVVFCEIKAIPVKWYFILGCVILGLIASFICMRGWDELMNIIYKFSIPKELRSIYSTAEANGLTTNDVVETLEKFAEVADKAIETVTDSVVGAIQGDDEEKPEENSENSVG